jgi:hypothetical protein
VCGERSDDWWGLCRCAAYRGRAISSWAGDMRDTEVASSRFQPGGVERDVVLESGRAERWSNLGAVRGNFHFWTRLSLPRRIVQRRTQRTFVNYSTKKSLYTHIYIYAYVAQGNGISTTGSNNISRHSLPPSEELTTGTRISRCYHSTTTDEPKGHVTKINSYAKILSTNSYLIYIYFRPRVPALHNRHCALVIWSKCTSRALPDQHLCHIKTHKALGQPPNIPRIEE